MSSPISHALHCALLRLLKPLIRILLRNGIAYGDFAEIAKKSYVDVAFHEFNEPERKQSISRVSVLTGLTRKEARRLHVLEKDDQLPTPSRFNRATRVINGWLKDIDFQDKNGKPLPLHIDSAQHSFTELVRRYSGDMPAQAILRVLEAAGTIKVSSQQVTLLTHTYLPGNDPIEKIHSLGNEVAELIEAIDENLISRPGKPSLQVKI